MELQSKNFHQYFADYKHIAQGLKKLQITTPLDLQEQLLDIEKPIDNMILSAPADSGKTLGVILLALKKFYNQEQGILVFVCHSKQLSQNITHVVSTLTKIDILNLFMRKIDHLDKKAILIGSPLQLNSITKQFKDQMTQVIIIQADILFSFGYTDSMKLFASSLPKNVSYKLTCVQKTQQINNFKDTFLPKAAKIDYLPPVATQSAIKVQKSQDQLTHFYEVGQKIFVPISLYVSLKFNLVNPKILVLCQNLREVYRYYLLLQRGKLNGIGLYNYENPINLKFYTLSLWMNGNTNVLISTKQILDDLSGNLFKQNCKKSYKSNHFELLNMTTIITCNIAFLQNEFQHMLQIFHSKPFVMNFIENKQSEITALHKFIEHQNSNFANIKRKQLPITKKQLQAFRYRVNDVWMSLGNTRVQQFQKLDFKKKMLRSPDLKQYFEENKKQRDVLVKQINLLRKKIDNDCMRMSEFIPSYLVPECLKASYDQKIKQLQKTKQEQKGPEYIQKVRRVLKHIDMQEQNPQTTDISRLKLISNRKRWKLQHGFKLKKRNVKNQKKGIFQST